MRKSRFKEEQIVAALKEHEAGALAGEPRLPAGRSAGAWG